MRKNGLLSLVTALALGLVAGPVAADWLPVGSSINNNPVMPADRPAIAETNGTTNTVCITWQESNGSNYYVWAKQYDKDLNMWLPMGGYLNNNNTDQAVAPDMGMQDQIPMVCWSEYTSNSQVWVKWFNDSWWEPAAGTMLNNDGGQNALGPRMAIDGLTPVVTWLEYAGSSYQVFIRRYNFTDWDMVGANLNMDVNQNAYAPDITASNGHMFVAWQEETPAGKKQVFVREYDGVSSWNPIGGPLNMMPALDATNPRINVDGDGSVPHVVWEEFNGFNREIYVKRLNGAAWELAGSGSLNINPTMDAFAPDIDIWAGEPFVAWCESNGTTTQVYVKRFTAGAWTLLDGSLNVSPGHGANHPDIHVIDNTPYVAWSEGDGITDYRIYCKHWTWNTPTITPTLSPTVTSTQTPTPTPIGSSPTATFVPTLTATPFGATVTATFTATLTPTPIGSSPTFTTTHTSTPTPIGFSPTFTTTHTPTPLGTTATATFTVTMTPTPREELEPTAIPTFTSTPRALQPGAGNPVVIRGNVLKPSTSHPMQIGLYLERTQRVKIKVYTLRGKLVITLVDRVVQAGSFEAAWNGANRDRLTVRSGVYIVYIETEEFKEKRKMVVIR